MIRGLWAYWVVLCVALIALTSRAVGQPCTPQWLPGEGHIGTRGTVKALAIWRDSGSATSELLVAGEFTYAGGTPGTRNVARWDGQRWRGVGAGGPSGPVNAVTAWDADGAGPAAPLIAVGGEFYDVPPAAPQANNVAVWDGQTWSACAGGTDGLVYAATSWDPDGPGPTAPLLVVGGQFAHAGGVATGGIAAWNGAAWSSLGTGIPSVVYALTSWDEDGPGPKNPVLVATGNFWLDPLGISARSIAVWDGVAWRALQGGLSSPGRALATADLDGSGPGGVFLIVAGDFAAAGGVTVNHVAVWSGSAWSALGSGVPDIEFARGVAAWDPDGVGPQPPLVAVTGYRYPTGSPPAAGRTRIWDGSAWSTTPDTDDQALALAAWGPDGEGSRIFCGGSFDRAGVVSVNNITYLDQNTWQPLGRGFDAAISGLTVWDPDAMGPEPARLIASGAFTAVGDLELGHIAAWDGQIWSPLGTGLNSGVDTLVVWDPDGEGPLHPLLIAGGGFTASGATSLNRIAAWDGAAWSALGPGFDGVVSALATWDPDGPGPQPRALIAGGAFTKSGSTTVRYVARWTGVSWVPLAAGFSSPVYALAAWDPDDAGPLNEQLIAGGTFTKSGTAPMSRIASWDGVSWQPLGSGLDSGVHSLGLHDFDGPDGAPPSLVVGGSFILAGGLESRYVAVWNGAWSALTGGLLINGLTESLFSFKLDPFDPEPPTLFAGGTLWLSPTHMSGLIRWDGSQWQAAATGELSPVTALAAFRPTGARSDQLIAGGSFVAVEQKPVSYFARWGCPSCAADLNADGVVDFGDYLEFLNLYDSQDPAADLNGDGVIDFGDYLEFLNHYDAGC